MIPTLEVGITLYKLTALVTTPENVTIKATRFAVDLQPIAVLHKDANLHTLTYYSVSYTKHLTMIGSCSE